MSLTRVERIIADLHLVFRLNHTLYQNKSRRNFLSLTHHAIWQKSKKWLNEAVIIDHIMNGAVNTLNHAAMFASRVHDRQGTHISDDWRHHHQGKYTPAHRPWCDRLRSLHYLAPRLLFDVKRLKHYDLDARYGWHICKLGSDRKSRSEQLDQKPPKSGLNGPHSAVEERWPYQQISRKPTPEQISGCFQIKFASEAIAGLGETVYQKNKSEKREPVAAEDSPKQEM